MRQLRHLLTSIFLIFCLATAHGAETKSLNNNLSDSIITTIITAKYTKSTMLNPLKIHVSTKDGVVSLSGNVKDRNSYREALHIARNTHGVKKVVSKKLEIRRANTAITDAYITTKVEAAILTAKIFDDESIPLVGINASTNNGVVTLRGQVKSANAIKSITTRIGRVRGVSKVVSKLTVRVG